VARHPLDQRVQNGGRPPLDPKSNEPNFQTDITRRFEKDADANAQLDRTAHLDSVKQEDYDPVLYPGGHGPMWDLADDKYSVKLLESVVATGKTFAVVCHSTGATRTPARSAATAISRAAVDLPEPPLGVCRTTVSIAAL
jgi:putative intracellular protease/amidase